MKDLWSSNALWASTVTVGTVLVLVIAKTIAYFYSDSTAVLSSLIDSVSDVGLSLSTWYAIKISMKPADDDHRHGHGKIEGVAALFQASVLFGSSVFLLFSAAQRFFDPVQIEDHVPTIVLMVFSGLSSLFLTYMQRRASKASGSLALEADQAHYATDVWMNGLVILVLLLDYVDIGPAWLDPLCGIFVALLFAHAAANIARGAIDMLMDREVEPSIRERILALITAPQDVKGVHDLRIIRSGMRMFVSLDMEVDGDLSLSHAHEIAQETEFRILKEFPQAEIIIHLDPEGDTEDTRHGDYVI